MPKTAPVLRRSWPSCKSLASRLCMRWSLRSKAAFTLSASNRTGMCCGQLASQALPLGIGGGQIAAGLGRDEVAQFRGDLRLPRAAPCGSRCAHAHQVLLGDYADFLALQLADLGSRCTGLDCAAGGRAAQEPIAAAGTRRVQAGLGQGCIQDDVPCPASLPVPWALRSKALVLMSWPAPRVRLLPA